MSIQLGVKLKFIEDVMTQQEIRTSLLPEDAVEAGATPPGRYYIKDVEAVDDFDYGGQQDKQSALKMILVNEGGVEFENFWGVGQKTRIWPTKEKDGFTGAPMTKACNAFHLFDQAVRTGGMPANRLAGGNVKEAFEGLWCDFEEFTPPGRTANSRGNMPKTLIPIKVYLDGQQPAAPVVTSPAAVAPPQAPPASTQAPAPPPPPTAPQAPPPGTPPAPPEPTPTVDVSAFYPDMIRIAQEMLAEEGTQNTRQQLSVDVFNKLMNGDGPAGPEQKGVAMTALFQDGFTQALVAAGMTLTGEVIS